MPQSIKMLRPASYPLPQYKPAKANYGYQHRQWRRIVLLKDPICRYEGGCNQRSTDADHIVRISEGGARFDLDNGQGLCKSHHSIKTWKEAHRSKSSK